MKRSSSRGIAFAAIAAMVLSVHAQDNNIQYPTITQQPMDQCVALGGTVTFSVTANNATSYQWLMNNVAIEGETNNSIQITNASVANVGFYSAFVYNGSDAVPTRSANLNVYILSSAPSLLSSVSSGVSGAASGLLAPLDVPGGGGGPFLVVFGAPVVSGGGSSDCPGKYSGYATYTPPSGWGFQPASGATVFTATDTNLTVTKIQYVGCYGDNGCGQTTVTIPYPAMSSQYRFAIYFPTNYPVPTNAYPLSLVGFNP